MQDTIALLQAECDKAKAHEEKAYESRAYWCVEAGKAMKQRDEMALLLSEVLRLPGVWEGLSPEQRHEANLLFVQPAAEPSAAPGVEE